ncbi:unnamed protein product [Echinostoma caproni]|uniref:Beta-lactamase domain-containing protein n=1 Tax=Echinostoma caproni TaxID=27848 RepID=A0A183ADE6_9TREM|nr:unnamed protein product [Echinostoma caproni]
MRKAINFFNAETLIRPNGPGLGATLLLHDTQPAFLLGTIKHWPGLTSSIYQACLSMLANRDDRERRETVLRDARLQLPIPAEWSVQGCPPECDLLSLDQDEPEPPSAWLIERCFKPLFYTDTGLYCTAMPVRVSVDNEDNATNPGDGFIIRPVRLGLLLVHVTASVPPGISLEAVEQCVATCALG